jgi:hypothetical protein
MSSVIRRKDVRQKEVKSITIPVTGLGNLLGSEFSRLQHFSRQSAYRWLLGCHPYAPTALYPQKALLVLTSARRQLQGHSATGKI